MTVAITTVTAMYLCLGYAAATSIRIEMLRMLLGRAVLYLCTWWMLAGLVLSRFHPSAIAGVIVLVAATTLCHEEDP